MKRESVHNPTHRFSFDERFDEKMLSVYHNGFQCVKSPIHQFIGFSALIKSAVEAAAHTLPACRLCKQIIMPAQGHGYYTRLAKKERHPKAADTAAGFRVTKSHRLIRAFSSRTADAHAKNAPMS